MEKSATIFLRTCRPSQFAEIEGYRLAIEAKGMQDIIIADVKLFPLEDGFTATEGVHNRGYRVPLFGPKGRTEAEKAAYLHLERLADEYSNNSGLKLEKIN